MLRVAHLQSCLKKLILAALAFAPTGAFAWASTPASGAPALTQAAQQVYLDDAGFPRCITSPTDPDDGLLLLWDTTVHFRRPILAVALSDARLGLLRNSPRPTGCGQWRGYLATATADLMWTSLYQELPQGAPSMALASGVFPIPLDALVRLEQARRGSALYLGASTGADYLARYPVATFTRELNQRLSGWYGAGFAGEIFKAWLEAQPRNAAFKERVRASIAQIAAGTAKAPTRERYRGYKVLVAEGYMQTPLANRLKPFYDALDGFGVAHQTLAFDTIGAVQDNAAGFERQIEAELRSGQSRIILAAASKGAPEVLTALANLNAREPALARRVTAVLTLAGMFEGSFLVDWASHGIQSLLVEYALSDSAKAAGIEINSLDGFYGMSTESLARTAAFYAPRLPRITYINFVGVLTRDGIARDREIAKLQTSLAVPMVGEAGGNDGYIEYPGTAMPQAWGLDSTQIVFESSHAIVDGYYDRRDLADLRQRRLVFEGIFQAIADRIGTR